MCSLKGEKLAQWPYVGIELRLVTAVRIGDNVTLSSYGNRDVMGLLIPLGTVAYESEDHFILGTVSTA